MATTAKEIKAIWDHLKSNRGNWEDYWQRLAKYSIPAKSYINRTRTSGERLDADVYDSTAIFAAQMFAAGLQGFLTNPSQRWFALGLQDKDLMQNKVVKEWLKVVADRIFSALNGSNFNQQMHEFYLDLGVFGTATLYEEIDEREILRFSARPIDEIFVIENRRERIDTVYRKFKMTAHQAKERWGDKAGKNVNEAIEQGKLETKFDFIHCVRPRERFIVGKRDAMNMPFESVFVNESQNKKVSEGGFDEFPFFVTRFSKVSGEKYGYSPGMMALPDILMTNEIAFTTIVAAQKTVDPPLVLPSDGYLLPIKTSPGSVNFKNPGFDPREKPEPLFTGSNIPVGLEMEDRRREIIERHFAVDLFLMLNQADRQMTATEVVKRSEEKLLLLGPVLGRIMTELLNPLIERTFSILARRGLTPPVPEELSEIENFEIEYISVLARAQKLAESRGLDTFVGRVGEIAQVSPEAIDKVDVDKVIDEYAEIEGVNPTIVRDKDEVAVIRAARAEIAQQQAQMANLQGAADLIKTGAEANKTLTETEGGEVVPE